MRNLIAFILLAIWLILGSWFYTCKVKNLCGDEITSSQQSNLIAPEELSNAYNAVFECEDNLIAEKSKTEFNTNDIFASSVDKIAYFLKKHPETKVTVMGRFQADEVNESDFDNIGAARVDQIRQAMLAEGVAPEQIITKSEEQENMFDEEGFAENMNIIDFQFSEEYDELNAGDVKTAYKSTFAMKNFVTFRRDSASVQLLEGHQEPLENIVYYLNGNKDQNLKITVDFENGEKTDVGGQDIGFVRAFDLKQKLVERGLKKDRIEIESKQDYGIYGSEGLSTSEAVEMSFTFPDKSDESKLAEMKLERELEKELTEETQSLEETEAKENELAESKQETTAEKETSNSTNYGGGNLSESELEQNTNFGFRFGSTQIVGNKNLQESVEALKIFLEKNPDKTVEIIGHTCSVGDSNFNIALGEARAKAAQKLLEQYGISSAKLSLKSKGEFEPVANNKTPDGRAQNRRVEIDIR